MKTYRYVKGYAVVYEHTHRICNIMSGLECIGHHNNTSFKRGTGTGGYHINQFNQ